MLESVMFGAFSPDVPIDPPNWERYF